MIATSSARAAVAISGILLLSPLPAGQLSAQEVPVHGEVPKARLGLFLDASCEDTSLTGSEVSCRASPIVLSVVEDGPAFRAGVRVQDTLVALDGVPLESPEGRAALRSLDAGRPVRLTVAGPDGRRELEVVPELRAPAPVMRFEWRTPGAEGQESEVRVFRAPTPDVLRSFTWKSGQPDGSGRAFVLIEPGPEGELRVQITDADSMEVRALEPGRGDGTGATYVVESRELARRLIEVRDRTLEVARARLDSLVRMRQSRSSAPLPAPSEHRRLAGAEFRPMTPELAEYFGGVGSGLLVLRVIPDTPADRLGLRGGDVVVEIDGRSIDSIQGLLRAMDRDDSEPMNVKWIRKGSVSEGRIRLP